MLDLSVIEINKSLYNAHKFLLNLLYIKDIAMCKSIKNQNANVSDGYKKILLDSEFFRI